ncbi:NUDIX hydrolase [Arthrobacter sp. Br18]|uniref:NUDIX hydrolase n=1 Tax=Arthrobacter sp. Br18 TaxID=1312954 RepID=UPI00047E5514|nr:NUDIX hydrolase [Arthrobacter sp. Br18]
MTPGSRTPPVVVPRLAVSVLMVRGDVPNLEVFVQNRTSTMDFAAGMVVFPGGRVDEVDHAAARTWRVSPDLLERHARCWTETSIAVGSRAELLVSAEVLLAAAVREVEEETGAVLSVGDLIPWANWITPTGYSKRFDTFFYLTVLAEFLDPQHRTTEADSSHWAPVRGLLRGAAEGRLEMMRPTTVLLQELARHPGTWAAERRISPVGSL